MNFLKSISLAGILVGSLCITSCEKEEISDKSLDQILNEIQTETETNIGTSLETNIEAETATNATSVSIEKGDLLLSKDEKSISDQILILVNEYRNSKNLAPLSDNITAKIEALNHTEYQINLNDINHDNGKERANVLFKIENARAYAENVAFGFRTAKAVVDGWIASEGHRKNLEGDFSKSGIGTIANNQGVLYFTHILFK